MIRFLALVLLLSITPIHKVEKHKVVVEVTNLRNAEGSVRIGVYTDDRSFKEKQPYLKKSFDKTSVKNGRLKIELLLPKGTYGVALLDDENNNGEMDYGWVMPEEGFGFSNYWHTGMTKPDMEQFSFKVGATFELEKIKVKYL